MNFIALGALRRAPRESPKRPRNWYPLAVVVSALCAALLAFAAPAAKAREGVGSTRAPNVGLAPHAALPESAQRIDAARTRRDHQALAAYYERQATAARAIAAEHRKMARNYPALLAGARGDAGTAAPCIAIVSEQEGIAAEYEGMAEGHHELAKRSLP